MCTRMRSESEELGFFVYRAAYSRRNPCLSTKSRAPCVCQVLLCTLDSCISVGDPAVINFDAVRASRKKACSDGLLPRLLRQYSLRMDATASLTGGKQLWAGD